MLCNHHCGNWNCHTNPHPNCGCWNNFPCWNPPHIHPECVRPWPPYPTEPHPGRPGPIGPMGPAGPAGPMGPAAPTVYGGLINTTAQTLTFTAATPAAAPLNVQLAADGVTYAPANSITLTEGGDYAITYMLTNASITGITDADITLTLRANGVPLANTAVTTGTTDAETIYLQGETIQTLAAGTVLDMTITPSAALGLVLGANTTIAMIVQRVG